MKKHLFIFLLITVPIYGQNYFEGKLNYNITYETLSPAVPAELLAEQFGTSFTAYIKEDRYAMVYHGKGELGWMKVIVRLDQQCSYTEYEKNDTIIKSKFGSEKEKLIEFKKTPEDKKEILGELCESIIIKYEPLTPKPFFKSYQAKYYFNPKYKLNPKLYETYTDGFWNLFVNASKSISIRNEIEVQPLFKSVQEVVSVEEKTIPAELFEPNTSKIVTDEK